MRSRQPDLPFDPRSLKPPPAWQASPQPTAAAWGLPVQKRGFDRAQVTDFIEDVTRQVQAREAGHAVIPTNGVLYTADQVRGRRFATVRRGFDPEPVRSVLGRLADRLEPLEAGSAHPPRPDEPPSDDWDLGSMFS